MNDVHGQRATAIDLATGHNGSGVDGEFDAVGHQRCAEPVRETRGHLAAHRVTADQQQIRLRLARHGFGSDQKSVGLTDAKSRMIHTVDRWHAVLVEGLNSSVEGPASSEERGRDPGAQRAVERPRPAHQFEVRSAEGALWRGGNYQHSWHTDPPVTAA
jgi:hypothetical protein